MSHLRILSAGDAALVVEFDEVIDPVVNARVVALAGRLRERAAAGVIDVVATFRAVTLPLAMPAIVAGFLLAFTISLDDFVLASFTSGPGSTTLPMRIYSQARLGVTP